ncbi:MAG: CRISPR system precrRNA processing endoribonuclease RAMP protein Cas6 [Planctomycetota bacterium]
MLPPFLGPTLRGAFGYQFRKQNCQTRLQTCEPCFLRSICPYFVVFEGHNPNPEGILGDYQRVPQPFVLNVDFQSESDRPNLLQWGITLFGQACKLWPYVVFAFNEIGKTGLGKQRVKYQLEQCTDCNSGSTIWERGESGKLTGQPVFADVSARKAVPLGLSTIRFAFQTPVRIRSQGLDNLDALSGLDIMLQGQRRHRVFEECFGTAETGRKPDFIEPEQFETVHYNLKPWSITRFSGRQQKKVALQGLYGEITIRGPWAQTGEWLQAVEAIHLGKSTSFGLGRVSWEVIE